MAVDCVSESEAPIVERLVAVEIILDFVGMAHVVANAGDVMSLEQPESDVESGNAGEVVYHVCVKRANERQLLVEVASCDKAANEIVVDILIVSSNDVVDVNLWNQGDAPIVWRKI